MLNKIRSQQAIVIGAIVLLIGFLFSRDIKGLVKPKETGKEIASPDPVVEPSHLTIAQASATAKNLVGNNISKEITLLENDYQSAKGAEKADKAKLIAQKWDDVEQSVPSALYLEVAATEEPNLNNWLNAGIRFLKAFDNVKDSLTQPIMLQKANASFKNAVALDSTNLEAKAGLGVTIVNGFGPPMEGIGMLLDVVKKDPKNLKAQMNLGLFAIKSGQFDKAITRFKYIINNIKETPDVYFYLATAYENLGNNKEAIDAYLKSKKMAANPTLTSFIEKKVAELKNKI